MKKWLKENWPLLGLGLLLVIYLGTSIDSCVDKRNYNKEIKALNSDNSVLKAAIEFKDRENKDIKKEIAGIEEENTGIRKELRGKDSLILALRADNKAWQEKVEELPPSGLVQVARRLVNTEEIWQREDGILFSLAAARTTINILGQFTFVEEERATLVVAYEKKRLEAQNLQSIIGNERIISRNKDIQLAKKDLIIVNWKGKFNLSEQKGKRTRGKGRKEGGILGFIIGLAAGFFLGK